MPDDPTSFLSPIRERRALVAAANLRADAFGDVYAAMVQLAREDSAFLLAAVEAVLELHRPVGDGCAAGGCTWSWPCPTILAITRKITRKGAGGGT